MTLLCELAKKYETDKGGQHYRYGGGDSDTCHNYTPFYHAWFDEDRATVKSVLEIGVNAGSSLRMWKEYFPSAHIIGIDCDPKCLKEAEDRIEIEIADQNNPDQLRAVVGARAFDIILDDGSHFREHQITSLKTLLPYLAPGGYYIVEDLGRGGTEAQFLPLLEAAAATVDNTTHEAGIFKVEGGLGPKVQPYEWLFVVRRVK